jgi:hypothetical protein
MKNVQVSFTGQEAEGTLFATIYNPEVLPSGLRSQLLRYGLSLATSQRPQTSGVLNGSRRGFTELINTYGLTMEVVAAKPRVQ